MSLCGSRSVACGRSDEPKLEPVDGNFCVPECLLATTSSRSDASGMIATPKSGTAAIGMKSSQTATAQTLPSAAKK
jgi:hypothetical protein